VHRHQARVRDLGDPEVGAGAGFGREGLLELGYEDRHAQALRCRTLARVVQAVTEEDDPGEILGAQALDHAVQAGPQVAARRVEDDLIQRWQALLELGTEAVAHDAVALGQRRGATLIEEGQGPVAARLAVLPRVVGHAGRDIQRQNQHWRLARHHR